MRNVADEPRRSVAEAEREGKSKVRVAVVSDRALVAEGLRRIVPRADSATSVLVARAGGVATAIGDALDADVVVLDGRIEGAGDLVRALVAPVGGSSVIAIGDSSAARAMELLSAGALAYLDSEATVDELEQALAAAVRGDRLVPPRLVGELLERTLMESRWSERGQPLTRREVEVAALLRSGQSNKEIARRLQIEVSTVKNHVHSILVKLGLHGRGEIARWSGGNSTVAFGCRAEPEPSGCRYLDP